MPQKRFKNDDPLDNFIIKIWEDEEARNKAKKLWPNKDWTENVDLLELHADGEYVINGDSFAKTSSF
ncbi:MAG: hypothetical protein ACOC85_02745 [Thermoplasmatota archaeon]